MEPLFHQVTWSRGWGPPSSWPAPTSHPHSPREASSDYSPAPLSSPPAPSPPSGAPRSSSWGHYKYNHEKILQCTVSDLLSGGWGLITCRCWARVSSCRQRPPSWRWTSSPFIGGVPGVHRMLHGAITLIPPIPLPPVTRYLAPVVFRSRRIVLVEYISLTQTFYCVNTFLNENLILFDIYFIEVSAAPLPLPVAFQTK